MPLSVWMARTACSSLAFSPSVAVASYLPTPVGMPNFSRKISQNLSPLRLNSTGQYSQCAKPRP
ncbi:hypothetical protein RLIN73S_05799 [Rhodanobacter lindaniclasticus]